MTSAGMMADDNAMTETRTLEAVSDHNNTTITTTTDTQDPTY